MVKLIELNPKNIYGWGGKFWTCYILGKVPEFIKSAEKVTDINPENKYAWGIKGWTYFILGKVEKSLECYEKYIELDKLDKKEYNVVRSSDYEWITKGYLLYLLEEFDKAIECVNKALEVNPMDKKYILALKGEILNSIGKYEEAIKCYDKVIDEKSTRYASYDDWSNAYALILKGNALSNLGKYEEAIKCYDKSLEINPNNPILILINKSGILFSKDAANTWLGKISAFSNLDIEVILEIYEKLLENSPNNAYAWTWKGNILSNLGKYEEAIKCYDRVFGDKSKLCFSTDQ